VQPAHKVQSGQSDPLVRKERPDRKVRKVTLEIWVLPDHKVPQAQPDRKE
jgi:hypothetical protein